MNPHVALWLGQRRSSQGVRGPSSNTDFGTEGIDNPGAGSEASSGLGSRVWALGFAFELLLYLKVGILALLNAGARVGPFGQIGAALQ